MIVMEVKKHEDMRMMRRPCPIVKDWRMPSGHEIDVSAGPQGNEKAYELAFVSYL